MADKRESKRRAGAERASLRAELQAGVLVVDFGGAKTLDIARKIRALGVYCEVWACNDPRVKSAAELGRAPARGLVLSAPPRALNIEGAALIKGELDQLGAPILGIGEGLKDFQAPIPAEQVEGAIGEALFREFIFERCGCAPEWDMARFLAADIARVQARVGADERVICGLSGGVDSSVVAAMLHRAIGARLSCVFVDHGLLRHQETERVRELFEGHFGVDLIVVDARDKFLGRLEGVLDPEQKRRIIGETFIEVFEQVAAEIPGAKYLAQGTLYPDVIESQNMLGPEATIKSHHNVGGLPEELGFELIEPLRELFKDEVRELGRELGLGADMVDRHPFPGPGLAVRIMGEITRERLDILRAADHIFIQALRDEELYHQVWQAFAVLLPVSTVGKSGGKRTYEQVIALRAVGSRDGMTAEFSQLPMAFLGRVSERIIREVDGVNRVVYDVSNKPPATIEWE